MKKLVNKSGSFEDTAKFNGEPKESFENRRYQCVCNNSSKCVLNKLQFVHVDTGQTPEERVAIIKTKALAARIADPSVKYCLTRLRSQN